MIPACAPTAPAANALPPLPSSLKILFIGTDAVLAGNRSGTGDSMTKAFPSMTLTDAAATFTAADVGSTITLAGWANPANNTTCLITAVPSSTQITFTNSAGVAETGSGTWQINGRISSVTDRIAGLIAVPTSGNGLVADVMTEASGKVLMSAIVAATTVQNNSAPDIGGLIAGLGNNDCSLYFYGKRESQVTGIVQSLHNTGDTHYIRASFNSTNTMRMIRNNGTLDSTTYATNAAIASTSMASWCWAFNNTGPEGQAFKNAASLGAPVTPGTQRPTDLATIRLGSGVTASGFSARAFGVFDTYATIADQALVDAYVSAVYV